MLRRRRRKEAWVHVRRHMPQLLEYKTGDGETKSFVYRAQPPFYRVWNGNDGLNSFRISGASEYYLRDDHEMNRCLIKKAAEKVTVRINTTGEKIEGEALSQLIEKLLEFGAFYQKLERKRIDQRLTETLLETMVGGEGLMRKDGLGLRELFVDELLLGKVNAALAEAGYKTRLIPDEEPGLWAIEVDGGSESGRRLINWELAAHVEFERAVDLYKSFLQPAPPPYLIQEGDSVIEIKSRGDLLSQILFLGAKNLGIQRFEHLGEMNPQQFWESTLDPEKRSLLQVKIDDAMKADELYTALISEQIESRSVQAVLDGLSETMNAVLEDVKEIKRDLKDLARGFNTLAGDGARLRAAYEELEARISTLEHKSS
jgi:DNA gyrase subunit B